SWCTVRQREAEQILVENTLNTNTMNNNLDVKFNIFRSEAITGQEKDSVTKSKNIHYPRTSLILVMLGEGQKRFPDSKSVPLLLLATRRTTLGWYVSRCHTVKSRWLFQ